MLVSAATVATRYWASQDPIDDGVSRRVTSLNMSDPFWLINERSRSLVDVGRGLKGPKTLDVQARLPEYDEIDIRVRITFIEGSYEVTYLRAEGFHGEPIPTDLLRKIPLRTIVRAAVGKELRNSNLDQAFDLSNFNGPEATERFTAFIYRMARVLGEAPTKAVMDYNGVSRSTASRMVAAARKAGHLGTDEVGQAGGARSRLEA